jgi:FkbM family methyltransferase
LIVRDFFRDRTNGFFVDVGAAWPIQYSNTYYLENHLGWTGIAVDALPEYGPSWEESRPRSRFYSYFVTDRADTLETFFRSEQTGVSSYLKEQAKGPSGEATYEEIQVPSTTLTRLLEKNGVSRIDFLSMDIEGAELSALAGFDIDRFRPELVCIEAKPANRRGIFEYFETHGYERLERYLEYDETNYYFSRRAAAVPVHDPYRDPQPTIPPGRPELLARAALALAASHVLPGLLLVGILGVGANALERWIAAAVLGGPISGALYWASLVSGAPALYWAALGVIDVAAVVLCLRDPGPYRAADSALSKPIAGLLLFITALGGAYLFSTGRFYQLDSRGDFAMDPAFTEETVFHAAMVDGLQTSYPPPLLSVSGARAESHPAGYHLQLAVWQRFFGLDRYDGIARVGVLWWLSLLVLSAFSFALRLLPSPGAALGAAVLSFGGGLGFLLEPGTTMSSWSPLFMDAGIVSILRIGPLLPALSLFFVALALLDQYLERSHRGSLAGSTFALLALFTLEELLAVQLLAAFVLGFSLARGPAAVRARRAALAFGLASAPVLFLALAFREFSFSVRPLDVVSRFTETIGRQEWAGAIARTVEGNWDARSLGLALAATTLWLAGFLGLRLLAAPGLVRDAFSLSGSVRSALSLFVLIGFSLTLLLRIAPAEPAGVPPQEALNRAFWFASFSGMASWLWTAEALAGVVRRLGKARGLAASAAGLLAFPSTVELLVHKTSPAGETLSVPAGEVAAASVGRALSRPEEVFVEPLTRARPSRPASLAGRSVVYDPFLAARDLPFPRQDLEFRRHAVAQFWSSPDPGYGAWFLSHFNVRWIYNPGDVLSAQAGGRWANPVFANGAATIYRVGTLSEVALRIPARIPLGNRGAVFLGQGWGPPESTPRVRRLLPGPATLYVPTNEARALRIELRLSKPHAAGRLKLGSRWVDLETAADRAVLDVPADESHRGLSRLELHWHGAAPLMVTGIGLSEDFLVQ